ncbi:unnamed protein product, partial [Discosporangium mesarthrocarpum]
MERELTGLQSANAFSLTNLPPDRKTVGAKWIYKWKTDEMGIVTRAKARLVEKGYNQKPGVDYFETFAPTPAASTVRLLTAVANEQRLELIHFDAEQAFLHADIDEVFVRLPPGCADPCLFRYMDEDEVPLLVVTHVDDMIAAGSVGDCDALSEALLTEFPTNNLGPLSWYTGCAFERDWEKGTLTITQTAYIDQLCERFDVSSPSLLPAIAHEQTIPRQDNDEPGPERFRELIGALLWVVCMSRPDISNPVRALARY